MCVCVAFRFLKIVFDVEYFLFFFFFLRSFVEFVAILFLFSVLVFLAMRHTGASLTRDQTRSPGIGRQDLNHWTTRRAPPHALIMLLLTY